MKRMSPILAVALALALATNARAAFDTYLKIDEVPGESIDAAHAGWIDLLSVRWSAPPPAPPAAPAPAGVARRGPGSITLSKKLDKASPLLKQAAAAGKFLHAVQIELPKGAAQGPKSYYRYELKNVMVSSISMAGGGAGGVAPTEQLTLNFAAIELKYEEQKGPPKDPKPGAAPGQVSAAGSSAAGGSAYSLARTPTPTKAAK